jgi:hypothetical protein
VSGEARARAIVAERSAGICEAAIPGVCLGRATNVHHRNKAGRVWAPSNLLHLCGSGTTGCHGHIEANPAWAMEQGLWLEHSDDPRAVSVHMRWASMRGWFVLDDEGLLEFDTMPLEPMSMRLVQELVSPGTSWG